MATKKKLLEAAAGNAGGAALNVEEVFSTYLYTGTGSTQTITNGIDLSGEGGMVWIKSRSNAYSNYIYDTERGTSGGAGYYLATNSTIASTLGSVGKDLYQFNSDGFELGPNFNAGINNSGYEQASWTWRKAPRFFDCVTYTGTGSARTISHSLNTTPGLIICKPTSGTGQWAVWHRSNGNNNVLYLNLNYANSTSSTVWNNTAPTSTVFSVGASAATNETGVSYVAYLFAHNDGDGEFGPNGDADIIKCGSYTGNGTSQEIDLGFEAQWVLIKNTTNSQSWAIVDNMRGLTVEGVNDEILTPNDSTAEGADSRVFPTASGFGVHTADYRYNGSGSNYIYIAIRRGPMAVPESATDVFAIDGLAGATSPDPWFTSNFVTDLALLKQPDSVNNWIIGSRLQGTKRMSTDLTNAETDQSNQQWDYMDGVYDASTNATYLSWMWKRAPNFFDVVAYTGTGNNSTRMVDHNLTVKPEMVWVKRRDDLGSWFVTAESLGVNNYLNLDSSGTGYTYTNMGAHTATQFSARGLDSTNGTFIAYLFASLAGVSKVGSYTGNGSTQTIDCGFSSGARFVLIKRTDSTGDWYVWDTERGIVAANDPHLSLNSTAAEVTTDDSIDPVSSGFAVNQVAATNINVSSASYIFYAVS